MSILIQTLATMIENDSLISVPTSGNTDSSTWDLYQPLHYHNYYCIIYNIFDRVLSDDTMDYPS